MKSPVRHGDAVGETRYLAIAIDYGRSVLLASRISAIWWVAFWFPWMMWDQSHWKDRHLLGITIALFGLSLGCYWAFLGYRAKRSLRLNSMALGKLGMPVGTRRDWRNEGPQVGGILFDPHQEMTPRSECS